MFFSTIYVFFGFFFFFSVWIRQQNKSTPLSGTLNIQLFCFFSLTECLSVYIWISTRTVTRPSGEHRSRNIQPNNRPWQLLHVCFVFQTEHIFCTANSHIVSFQLKGLILLYLICPTWLLFGPCLICCCWFWPCPRWVWFGHSCIHNEFMELISIIAAKQFVGFNIMSTDTRKGRDWCRYLSLFFFPSCIFYYIDFVSFIYPLTSRLCVPESLPCITSMT